MGNIKLMIHFMYNTNDALHCVTHVVHIAALVNFFMSNLSQERNVGFFFNLTQQ